MYITTNKSFSPTNMVLLRSHRKQLIERQSCASLLKTWHYNLSGSAAKWDIISYYITNNALLLFIWLIPSLYLAYFIDSKSHAFLSKLFRKVVKQKFSFMRNLHSNVLDDINFGIKLHDVAIKRSQQLITNTNVHIRDCNIRGIPFRFCTLDISSQSPHIHESILVCPIKTVSRKRPLFIKHLIFNERLQIRNPIEHTDNNNIPQSLPLYTYNKHYQILSKRKIQNYKRRKMK
jgi:hypothetical protein